LYRSFQSFYPYFYFNAFSAFNVFSSACRGRAFAVFFILSQILADFKGNREIQAGIQASYDFRT